MSSSDNDSRNSLMSPSPSRPSFRFVHIEHNKTHVSKILLRIRMRYALCFVCILWLVFDVGMYSMSERASRPTTVHNQDWAFLSLYLDSQVSPTPKLSFWSFPCAAQFLKGKLIGLFLSHTPVSDEFHLRMVWASFLAQGKWKLCEFFLSGIITNNHE